MLERNWEEFWKNKDLAIPLLTLHQKQKADFMKDLCKEKINGKVLECGCFPGKWLAWFNKELNMQPYGIDTLPSEQTISFLKNHNIKAQIKQADVRKIPFKDNYFDVVYSFGLIEHFDDHKALIKEMARVLKKDGILITSWPNTLKFTFTRLMMKIHRDKDLEDMKPIPLEHILNIYKELNFQNIQYKKMGVWGLSWSKFLNKIKIINPLLKLLSKTNFFSADFTITGKN